MGDGINIHNPFVADAFYRTLHQHLVVALVLSALIGVWWAWRQPLWIFDSESIVRRTLRYGFGALWVLDGVLQLQSAMPLGLATSVFTEARDDTPTWAQGPINLAITIWNEHPVGAASLVVVLQLGIGFMLLAGRTSRTGALLSVVWSLVIWFSSGYGGLFAAGSSLYFGWPGAVVLYVMAGVIISRRSPFFDARAEWTLRWGLTTLLVGGGLWQLRPGTDFWASDTANGWWRMSRDMASMPQPEILQRLVRSTGDAALHLGPLWNLGASAVLIALGVLLWRVRRLTWLTTGFIAAFFFALWVLVQDTGLFGGLSTDPNSLLPLALLVVALHQSLVRSTPREVGDRVASPFTRSASRGVAAIGVGMLLVGSWSFLLTVRGDVESTLHVAANGEGTAVLTPAPPFQLTAPDGRRMGIPYLSGHVVALTFLDPVCYEECSLIGHQLVELLTSLPKNAPVDVIAVAANTKDHSQSQVENFLRRYSFDTVPRFHFVNGTTAELEATYANYGVTVHGGGEDGMSIHTNVVYLVDGRGQLRYIMTDTPAPGRAGISSAVVVLREQVARLLSER
jgi:cytochrome oxidase Cu insertion factor (SCO1/SenC/PrrC family)